MGIRNITIVVTSLLLAACEVNDDARPLEQPTLIAKWKFVSHIVSDCTNSDDNKEVLCSATAGECGILTIGENTWLWQQPLADGSIVMESGTYTLSTNIIILTGPTVPGMHGYSISGSFFSYTRTTLTFVNTSESNGCTYTQTYTKHNQPGVHPS